MHLNATVTNVTNQKGRPQAADEVNTRHGQCILVRKTSEHAQCLYSPLLFKWKYGASFSSPVTYLLHGAESFLRSLYSSPNIVREIKSRRMRWAGHVARMGEERGVYRVLVGKPEGRRPLGRPRHRWVDNIRMDLQEVRCGYMDWIGLAQDRDRWRTLVSAVMNLHVPWNAGNFLTSYKPVSFSRRSLHRGVIK